MREAGNDFEALAEEYGETKLEHMNFSRKCSCSTAFGECQPCFDARREAAATCPHCLVRVGDDETDMYRHLNVDHKLSKRESREVAKDQFK